MTGKIERFEDLKCWQKARELMNEIYNVCENSGLKRDWSTQHQIKRAVISTMNNISEGFGRYSEREFVRFLNISSASGMEVRSMLYVLLDRKYINKETFEKLYKLSISHINLTLGLIRYLTKNKLAS